MPDKGQRIGHPDEDEVIRRLRREVIAGQKRIEEKTGGKVKAPPKPPEVPLEQRPGVWNDIGEYRLAARRVARRRARRGELA